jgi:hypothetical protein
MVNMIKEIEERFSRWVNFPFAYPHYETLQKWDEGEYIRRFQATYDDRFGSCLRIHHPVNLESVEST